VFLGGIGRETGRLLDYTLARLTPGGRLVVNVGSIDQLAAAHEVLQRATGDADVWMLQVARGTHQLEQVRFDAARISFLLAARK
jgi:precorrin-6Y C5,15-methyltransferase (decarboxylating)